MIDSLHNFRFPFSIAKIWKNMSLNSTSIPETKCNSITAINHLFGPDGILLGVTFPKTACELTNLLNASSYIDCQKDFDSKPT